MNLPRYKSHKIVEAVKITSLEFMGYGKARIAHSDGFVETNDRYRDRFHGGEDYGGDPDLGYYVRYEDGYESWSPTKAFEEGYTKVE